MANPASMNPKPKIRHMWPKPPFHKYPKAHSIWVWSETETDLIEINCGISNDSYPASVAHFRGAPALQKVATKSESSFGSEALKPYTPGA